MTRAIDIGHGPTGPFDLDLDAYRTTGLRIGIFGASGTGKGWLLGKIIEGTIGWSVPCIMVDAEQELWTFKEVGALVVGGKHADAPFVEDREAIDAVVRFSLTTGTPVVFDIGVEAEADEATAARLGNAVMQRVWAIEDDLRIEMLFAATEASIFAPQIVPRGERRPETMRQMFQRGRKRGVHVAIETQRLADIQKSCISQANERFFGAINTADDWAAVSRNVPGRTFIEQQRLPQGVFYTVPDGLEVRVGARNVTHGGGGPEAGEVTIRETRRAGLDEVLSIIRKAAADVQAACADSSASSEAKKPEPARHSARMISREQWDRVQTEAAEQRKRAERAEQAAAAAREDEQAAQAEADEATRLADSMRETLAGVEGFRDALRRFLGDMGTAVMAEAQAGAEASEALMREMRRIAREEAQGNGTAPVRLVPTEALRTRYLEDAAQRLVERMRALEPDEREALLFLLAHPDQFHSINAVAKALTGNDGGTGHSRYSAALAVLVRTGLASAGGSGRMGRKATVEDWVQKALGPHNPTAEDIERVRDRALEVILADDA